MGHFSELIGAHILKDWLFFFSPAMEVNFLEKLPEMEALQIFQSSYLSCGESLKLAWTILFYQHSY